MKYANFDYQNFPSVIITFTGVKSTDANFQAYLAEIRAIYDRGEKFALIFDATNASLPGLKHQLMQANWLRKHNDLIKKYCLGTAYVISNKLVRGILKSIFTLQKQPVPYTIVDNLNAAVNYSLACIHSPQNSSQYA